MDRVLNQTNLSNKRLGPMLDEPSFFDERTALNLERRTPNRGSSFRLNNIPEVDDKQDDLLDDNPVKEGEPN